MDSTSMAEPVESRGKRKTLTDNERRLARIIAINPEIELFRAGWLAGYQGGDPDLPVPEDQGARRSITTMVKRVLTRDHVQDEIDRLRSAHAREHQARAHVGDRDALVEEKARAMRLDAIAADVDRTDLGAELLALKLGAAMFDPGEIIEWEEVDNGFTRVKSSRDMTAAQRRLIQKIQFHPRCGACGADHEKPGLTLEFVPKATFAQQATKQLGLDAPRKLEVTGKDGAPLIGGQDRGIRGETVEAIRRLIVGAPVELPAIKGGG